MQAKRFSLRCAVRCSDRARTVLSIYASVWQSLLRSEFNTSSNLSLCEVGRKKLVAQKRSSRHSLLRRHVLISAHCSSAQQDSHGLENSNFQQPRPSSAVPVLSFPSARHSNQIFQIAQKFRGCGTSQIKHCKGAVFFVRYGAVCLELRGVQLHLAQLHLIDKSSKLGTNPRLGPGILPATITAKGTSGLVLQASSHWRPRKRFLPV